jgi:hypothetical protein
MHVPEVKCKILLLGQWALFGRGYEVDPVVVMRLWQNELGRSLVGFTVRQGSTANAVPVGLLFRRQNK